jgi:hypothetical protein
MSFLAQSDAITLLGWALIAASLALAVDTLAGIRRPRSRTAQILRAYRPADWSASKPARGTRPIGATDQWQRLTTIVESSVANAQSILELHARATLELEAVDDGLTEVLAAWNNYLNTPSQPEQVVVAPAPTAQPIAA